MPKILGLDVGSSTIGIAVSDTLGWTAQGVTTIRRKSMQHDLESLQHLIRQHNISEVVVGIPLKMNGKNRCTDQENSPFYEYLTKDLPSSDL